MRTAQRVAEMQAKDRGTADYRKEPVDTTMPKDKQMNPVQNSVNGVNDIKVTTNARAKLLSLGFALETANSLLDGSKPELGDKNLHKLKGYFTTDQIKNMVTIAEGQTL